MLISILLLYKCQIPELLEIELSEEEQAKLNNSCKVIKEMREQSIDKIIKG